MWAGCLIAFVIDNVVGCEKVRIYGDGRSPALCSCRLRFGLSLIKPLASASPSHEKAGAGCRMSAPGAPFFRTITSIKI